MPGHQLRCIVSVPIDTNLGEDVITNTWYFDGGIIGATPADVAEDSEGILIAFYNAIDTYFPVTVGGTAAGRMRWYNLADPEPRVPVRDTTFAIVDSGGDGLPHEVAVCLSFAAADQAGAVRARRRGRIYLGPIRASAAVVLDGGVRVQTAAVDAIATAAQTLMNAGDADKHWAIYSPTTQANGATLADSVNDVKKVWVDNAFDIHRSRGQKATYRKTFVAP